VAGRGIPKAAAGVARPTASRKPRGPVGLDTPIGDSGFVGALALRRAGSRLGIRTVRDLLFHLPRRYDDLRELSTARDLYRIEEGERASARLQVRGIKVAPTFRRHIERTTVYLGDDTGDVEATWFGRRYIASRIKEGQWIVISGKIKRRGFTTSFDNADFQADDGSELLHAGRIVPVYRLSAGLTATTLRRAIRQALDVVGGSYPEYLPSAALPPGGAAVGRDPGAAAERGAAAAAGAAAERGAAAAGLDPGAAAERGAAAELGGRGDRPMAIAAALENAHYPDDFALRDRALSRLGFDELLALQIGMVARDRLRRRAVGEPVEVAPERAREAVALVEAAITEQVQARTGSTDRAALTPDQAAAVRDIVADLSHARPMMRLLQGDVGSGKTAVAALALAFVADAGRQGALLAPTDLLARQHAVALRRLVNPLGHDVTLLTGSLSASEKREALETIAGPSAGEGLLGLTAGRIVVGTHALFTESVEFSDLALAVVDEQHRFGVAQREALGAKGRSPHVLLMTATPIPRTLGQLLLADLDVSDLRTPPTGRLRIRTGIRRGSDLAGVAGDPTKGAYPLIVREVRAGHRAFVVVPLVEEDQDTAARSADEVAAALPAQLADAAARAGLPAEPAPRIGVVHGQMKAAARDATMDLFRRGELDILVGTTVLEVGVDVPEATVMLILDADRFGLAQLHQLRGRVGRGEAQSYCILVSDSYDETARARLDALATHDDGFELAELDLELRREGELLGLNQSGLPTLRIASLREPRDRDRAARAREVAETLVDDAGALRPGNEALAIELERGWLARVGAGEVLADISAGDGTAGAAAGAADEPAASDGAETALDKAPRSVATRSSRPTPRSGDGSQGTRQ
jgi:ATP-dependent DNA helicase RecG